MSNCNVIVGLKLSKDNHKKVFALHTLYFEYFTLLFWYWIFYSILLHGKTSLTKTQLIRSMQLMDWMCSNWMIVPIIWMDLQLTLPWNNLNSNSIKFNGSMDFEKMFKLQNVWPDSIRSMEWRITMPLHWQCNGKGNY